MISTRPATSSLAVVLSLLTLLAFNSSVVRAEDKGLEDLDKATDLQLTAQTSEDLDRVVSLCESAIEKGLDKDNTEFAKQLIVSSLWQQASQRAARIFGPPRPDPQWQQIREDVKKLIDKIHKYDATFAEAHVLNAKLESLPGGERKNVVNSIDAAIDSYKAQKDQQELAKTYLLRAQLRETADERMADIEAAIKADPSSVEALQLRAAVHIEQGDIEKAIADFEELIKQNPENVAVHQALATTYASTKKYDEAIKHLGKAIELAPENALNYAMRAEVYEAQEKYDEALADLTQALKVQPNNGGALLARARLHYLRENLDEARADINQLLQERPGLSQGILLRSMIEAADGDFQKAIVDLQNILRADPTNVDLQLQLAAFYVADERPRKAIQVLSGIIAADEGNWRALRSRGDALLSVGKHAEAIQDYDQALKIQSEPPADERIRDVWVNILNNLAWVLSTSPKDEVRNGKRAIELATRACEVSNFEKSHIISTLAAAHAETGDFENAVKWSKKCVEMGIEELPDQIEQLRDELKHYEEGKPFRELQEVEEKLDPPARVLDT
ncbi:MAG TPA: tetratricopeptide repeat protein [Pirellulaceae bacterium]|nr:tetratricopeptide repeat protein [Pirellulaceae bacterium]